MSNGKKSVFLKAAIAVPKLAAKTVITATKVAESGLAVAESTGKITQHLAGSVEKIAESVEKHSGALANSTLKIGQHALNTVEGVTKVISSGTKVASIQVNKKLAVSSNRLKAIQATSNERTESQKKEILIQFELKQKKLELNKQKNLLKQNYKGEVDKRKHYMDMLKLEKNTTDTLIKFYENEIDIVKNLSKVVNNSLENVRSTICAGKYFSFSLSCKRHQNFNSSGFRVKIETIRKKYKNYCDNILIKLKSKLKMASVSKKLELFTDYYIQEVQILTDINSKLLDYVVEIQSITIQNSISNNNKKIINSSISKLENLIGKKKNQYGNLIGKNNNQYKNLIRKNNNQYKNLIRKNNNQYQNLIRKNNNQYQNLIGKNNTEIISINDKINNNNQNKKLIGKNNNQNKYLIGKNNNQNKNLIPIISQ